MIETAGKWSRSEWPVYFLASLISLFERSALHASHVLVAVNEINDDEGMAKIEEAVERGVAVLIDSGVFSLTQQHARRHGVTMDEALGLAPDEIDGFDELMFKYRRVIARVGDRAWGYIELDQGGIENKRKTRAMLEAEGLRPIPVYHPINDGWDYFDELASRYDRICFGNVVQAAAPTRRRLLVTAFERAARYPHLWVHCLGVSPNAWVSSVPLHSSDSSAWNGLVRYARNDVRTAAEPFDDFGVEYAPRVGEGERSYNRNIDLSAIEAEMMSRNVLNMRREYRARGLGEVGLGDLPDMRIPQLADRAGGPRVSASEAPA